MKNRALVVIDLQVGLIVERPLLQLEQVIQQVNQRIDYYNELGRPVIFVQHEDEILVPHSQNWQLFPELHRGKKEYFIGKTHANAFYHTDLAALFDHLAITELEICGAQCEYCVDTTIRMAHGLGYQLFMKRGTVTTLDNGRLAAAEILHHHEAIWDNRFLTFI